MLRYSPLITKTGKPFADNHIKSIEWLPGFRHHPAARVLARDKNRILGNTPLQVLCQQPRLHLEHSPIR